MSTLVVTCMINRWRAKIDWKEVYNMGDPPRMGDREKRVGGEKKEEAMAVCMILKTPVT